MANSTIVNPWSLDTVSTANSPVSIEQLRIKYMVFVPTASGNAVVVADAPNANILWQGTAATDVRPLEFRPSEPVIVNGLYLRTLGGASSVLYVYL